jgi:glycosyltransferase involved in cell wall biosynthesis
MPLVSIVLPTYNRADLLPHSIHSVLNQTYHNLELIIIDDHSNSETEAVVKGFNDERIKYTRNQSNLKLPRSLNKGFSLSKGAYLTWTSDDNVYADTAIERMVEYIREKNCEFVYADYYHFSELDKASGEPVDPRHIKLPDQQQLQRSNGVGACFMYTRRVYEEIGDYDPELFLVEDYDYFIRISRTFDMCHINEPLYYFSRHDQSLYTSRFCEVKASDILVRYKNRLLDKREALDTTVDLILRNSEMINNLFLRSGFHVTSKISYRMSIFFRKSVSRYLTHRLGKKLFRILDSYDAGKIAFKEARDSLSDLLQGIIRLQYSE